MGPLSSGMVVAERYRIVGPIGAGGMGAVYRAVQEPLDREVALKVIKDPSANDEARARFVREAKAIASLRDPGIVTVHDFGVTADGLLYLAMELIDGESLETRLQRLGRLSIDEAVGIIGALARCLAAAHAERIVHRDVKPANVMLPRSGGVKLLDFGLARRSTGAPSVTLPGVIVGSPGYIPPEIVMTGKDDPRSDVYALGVIAYEMIAGVPLFSAPTPMALVMKHAQERPPRLHDVPGTPRELADLVERMLEKSPNQRPSSVDVARILGPVGAPPGALPDLPATPFSSGSGRTGGLSRPNRPSIAVLPFVSLSPDPDQDYFADGLTEDVICGLARHASLFVIGRATVFAYKGQKVSTQLLGRELGVRYVVEGSVRRAGERVRVTATLVDTDSSTQLWSQRFDRDLADVFAVQDELTSAIVGALPGRIEAAHLEKGRKRPTEDLAAYDLVLQGRELHHRGSLDDNRKARNLLDRAVQLDPEFVQAQVWRACVIGQGVVRGYVTEAANADRAELRSCMERASVRGQDDAECVRVLAEMALSDRAFDRAMELNERGLQLIPGEPRLLVQRGEILARVGRGAEAVDWIERAIRLDPLSAPAYSWQLALARFASGDYAGARDLLRRIASPSAKHEGLLAIAAYHLGDRAEADAHAAKLRAILHGVTVEVFEAMCPFAAEETQRACREALVALGLPRAGH